MRQELFSTWKNYISVGSLAILRFVAEPKQTKSVRVENSVLMGQIKLQGNQKNDDAFVVKCGKDLSGVLFFFLLEVCSLRMSLLIREQRVTL